MKNSVAEATSGSGQTRRMEALADGVFAIAMTILVLSIDIPKFPPGQAAEQLPRYLRSQLWPELSIYLLAFITLAAFWIGHVQQLHHIRKIDSGLFWLNILILMMVALIPFTTALSGDYGEIGIAVQLFEVNLLLVGLIYYWHWSYATRHHRLVDPKLDPGHISKTRRALLVIPAHSLAALAISRFSPSWSPSVYILIPFLCHQEKIKTRWISARRSKSG